MIRPALDWSKPNRIKNKQISVKKNHAGVGTGLKTIPEWLTGLKYISHGRDPFPCTPVEIWVNKTCSHHGPEGTWASKIPLEGNPSYQASRWNLGYLFPHQYQSHPFRSMILKRTKPTQKSPLTEVLVAGLWIGHPNSRSNPEDPTGPTVTPEITGLQNPLRSPG